MGVETAVIAGAGLIGSAMSSNAAGDAARTQANAANNAANLQYQQYQQQRADQEPWRQAGMTALGQLQDPSLSRTFTMQDFQQDPGYQFRMDEATKAIERSAAARGGVNSGATLKALQNRSQGLASEEYNNAYNRFNNDRDQRYNKLASLAGIGQTATNQMANASQNYASNAGNYMTQAANAQSAGQIGQANAVTGALNNGMNTWMQLQMLNKYGGGVAA